MIALRLPRRRKATPLVRPLYADPRKRWARRISLGAILFLATLIYVLAFQLIGRFMMVQFLLPLIAMVFVIIWALPERGPAPTRLLTGLFIGFIIALMLWPDYLAVALPGLPWLTAVRLIGFPMVLVLLYSLSTSRDFKAEMSAITQSSRAVLLAVTAFSVLLVLSIPLSADPAISANKVIVALTNLIAIFFISCYVFSKPGNAMRFVYLLWAVVLVLCAIGLWEARLSRIPWADSIPSFLAIEDENVKRILAGAARAATGIYRVQAKFTTSLTFAEFLVLSSPFFLHIAMTARAVWLRPFAWAMLPLVFWLIVKTDSRLGASGFFMTFVLYLLVWGSLRWYRDRDSIFGPAVTLAYPLIFAAFILATFYVGRLRAMVWGTGAHQFSNQAREVQWESAIPKILAQPWGHGWGRGADVLGYTNLAGVLTIDSYYLSILLELGIIGFFVYYAIFGITIARCGLYARHADTQELQLIAPIAISLINFVIIKSVLSQQEGHPVAFILAGMAIALIYRIKVKQGTAPVSRQLE